jgi:anti-sigma regulatory factor (Ser/Thr protein kinase)
MNGPKTGDGACTHTGCADAATVASFRKLARDWFNSTVNLDAERVSDIVLAIDEALTNCAEHAYSDQQAAAVMTLTIAYDRAEATVQVCVIDHGRWIEPDPAAINAVRGRGIILMHALADNCTITSGLDGTTVCLHFHRCPALNRTVS